MPADSPLRRPGCRTDKAGSARRSRDGAPGSKALQHQFRDTLQGFEHARPVQCIGAEALHSAKVQRVVHLIRAQDEIAGEILLVVLENDRELPDVHALGQQVVLQVLQALEIVVEPTSLAVRHEHDAVRALKHQLARGVVVALTGDGVQLKLGAEAGDRSEVQREKIKEQRSIRLGGKRDHPAPACLRNPPVHILQVGRLSGPARPVVDDLAGDLARGKVDERHAPYRPKSSLRLVSSSRSKSFGSGVAGACSRGAADTSCSTIWSKNSWTRPTEVSVPNTTRPIQRPRGVPAAASIQLRWAPPCTRAATREPPMIRASCSVGAAIAAPRATSVMTSTERA